MIKRLDVLREGLARGGLIRGEGLARGGAIGLGAQLSPPPALPPLSPRPSLPPPPSPPPPAAAAAKCAASCPFAALSGGGGGLFYTCGERIEWLINVQRLSRADACALVARTHAACARCDPATAAVHTSHALTSPPPPPPLAARPPHKTPRAPNLENLAVNAAASTAWTAHCADARCPFGTLDGGHT